MTPATRACLFAMSLAVPLTATVPVAAQEAVGVVASIKPVHSLVAGVMAGIATPDLLVSGGGSPHTHTLRPSDAEALERARVVFWVGEALETFLEDAIESLAPRAAIVELASVEGVVLLEPREGGAWDAHDHDDEGHGHEHEAAKTGHDHDRDKTAAGHDHDHAAFDGHLWLDPDNAKAIVAAAAAALAKADPQHAEAYRANGAAVIARLEALETELDAALAPVKDRPFIVFHDAYQYLEARFGLNGIGSITVTPDVQPGAARLKELRSRIAGLGAVCVFSEPQFEPRLVETVAEGTGARIAVLDPLGADLADGPDLYFEMMRANVAAMRDCLGGTS